MIKKYLLLVIPFFASSVAVADEGPWSEDFSPPQGDYTWIQLTSDEWVKGDVIAIYNDELIFDSDNLGDLTIDVEDIQRLFGRGFFEITLIGRSAISGELQIRDAMIVILAAGGRYEYPVADLVAITPSATREVDRWTGDVGLGLNVRQGNSDIAEVSVAMGFKRRTPVSRVTLDYLANVNETEGIRIANSHRANLSVDRFSGGRFFWRPISVQYYQDSFQNIRHQATADTGIGYQLVDSLRIDWDLQGGVGANYLRNVSVAEDEPIADVSPVTTLGSDFTVEVTSWIDYELLINMTFLNEKSGLYQHHIVSTLSTDLIGDIDFDVSFIWDRTEKPQERTDGSTPEQDDFRFLVSVGYDF